MQDATRMSVLQFESPFIRSRLEFLTHGFSHLYPRGAQEFILHGMTPLSPPCWFKYS